MKTRMGMGWVVCALVVACSESRKPSDDAHADAAAEPESQRHDIVANEPANGAAGGATKAGHEKGDAATDDEDPMGTSAAAGARAPGMHADAGCRMPMPGAHRGKDGGPQTDAASPGGAADDSPTPECGPGMHGAMPHKTPGMVPPPDDHGAPPPPPPPGGNGAPPPPPPAAGGMARPPSPAGNGAPPPPPAAGLGALPPPVAGGAARPSP